MARKSKPSNPTEHCRSELLDGKMISIDPSSGKSGVAGFARFDGGYLVDYGVITIPYSTSSYKRFQSLRKKLETDHGEEVDVLVIELLKSVRSVHYNVKSVLVQAAAVIAASLNWNKCAIVSAMSWQAIAKRLGGWIKRDDVDAVYMGYAAIALANGYKPSGWTKEAQIAFLEELAVHYKWKRNFEDGSNTDSQESNQG